MRAPWKLSIALLLLCSPSGLAVQGDNGGGGGTGVRYCGAPGGTPPVLPPAGGAGPAGDTVPEPLPEPIPSSRGGGGGGGGTPGPPAPPTVRGPGPGSGGGAQPPGAPGPGAPGAGASGTLDPSDWRMWWELNQNDFLQLREAAWNPGTLTEKSGFYLGAGSRFEALQSLQPSEDQLRKLVAPALAAVAAEHQDPEVLAPTLLAFAKLGQLPAPPGEPSRAQLLLERLSSPNPQIAEVAIIALGLCGERDLLFELSAILADDAEGRELVGRSRVPERMRAFAAYAMGLVAEREPLYEQTQFVLERLTRVLDDQSSRSSEVAIACINGLSLIDMPDSARAKSAEGAGSPLAGREALVQYLLAILRDRRMPIEVRAHIPRALARHVRPVGDDQKPAVANALFETIRRARLSTRKLRFGAVQALGLIGTSGPEPTDARIRQELEKALARGDAVTRCLSVIAIAKVSARPDTSTRKGMVGSPGLRDLLFRELMKGNGRSRPWAALALGVRGYMLRQAGEPLNESITAALIELMEAEASPNQAGAFAIALGLRGDIGAADVLRERLAYFHVDEARAHVALALGMVQSTDSTDQLRELIDASERQPLTLRACAAALVLLGDKSCGPQLARKMLEADNGPLRARYAWTLAWIGDARCLAPLVELIGDPGGNGATRAYAAIGLGWASERTILPWRTRLSSDVNYPAATASLFSLSGGGVLNLP